MRYDIDLSDAAIRDLGRLLPPVRRYTIAQLENLAEEPALLSERGDDIYPPDAQLFLFDYDYDNETWHLTVLFTYSEDERRLVIDRIKYLRVPND